MSKLPTGFFERARRLSRVGGGLVRGGAKSLLKRQGAGEELGEQLFEELDQMKGMAMKVGQILSYMEVGLPSATRDRLVQLQQGAQGLPFEQVQQLLEQELGAHHLQDLSPSPIAAASIGQVHRARLRGQAVAVKVRYPGIEQALRSDLLAMRKLGGLASLGTSVDAAALVADLVLSVESECDYRLEARHQAWFHETLQAHPLLRAPKVHLDHCSDGVLCSAWANGASFAELLQDSVQARQRAGRALCTLPWHTLMGHGVLHADPHPGNFLFSPKNQEKAVVVLDFGAVRHLASERVQAFAALARAALAGRDGQVLQAAQDLGLFPTWRGVDKGEVVALFQWFFTPYLKDQVRLDADWWAQGQRFTRPGHTNLRRMAMPPDWLWLQRTFWGLHAVLMRLDCALPLRSILEENLSQEWQPCPVPFETASAPQSIAP